MPAVMTQSVVVIVRPAEHQRRLGHAALATAGGRLSGEPNASTTHAPAWQFGLLACAVLNKRGW
jgi:hypothetical protein